MSKTADAMQREGQQLVDHIGRAIIASEGERVTITRMAEELKMSRKGLKLKIGRWAKQQRRADLKESTHWQLVDHWLTNLNASDAKREAYAKLIREIIESAELYGVASFKDVCRVLSLPYTCGRSWYAKFGGDDRPEIDGRQDPIARSTLHAHALGDVERVQLYQMTQLAKIRELRDLMAPRVAEIEEMAA